jgi:hypothetical protein
MKTFLSGILLVLLAQTAPAEVVNFDDAKPGTLPPNWVAGVTGKGTPKRSVEPDATAPSKPNVLMQSGEATFLWCVNQNASLADGFVEVKFKPVSGKEDQAGGVVWRWKDGDYYYVARANALEDNVRIYHVVKGRRIQFDGRDLKVSANQWHALRVDFQGGHFIVTFDGRRVIDADDETIKGKGAVGVWTKADSVTLFDDFNYGAVMLHDGVLVE